MKKMTKMMIMRRIMLIKMINNIGDGDEEVGKLR